MDIPLCHKPQIILTNQDALSLYEQQPDRFAGALAPDAAHCAAWSERLGALPAGLPLDCPSPSALSASDRENTEHGLPLTVQYMRLCKRTFRPLLHHRAAFYYLRNAPDFVSLRAAVLALGDLCGRTVIAELETEEEGRLSCGTDLCAAVGVLQRIGVTTVILTAQKPSAMTEALETVAPYARLTIGARMHSAWLRAQTPLYNTEIFLPAEFDGEKQLLQALETYQAARTVPREHGDFILAPDGIHAHFIDPTIDISDEIVCGPRLEEDLLEAEDDAGALKLLLETEDDVLALEEHCYMISRPVCLCASSAELLEQGLQVYPGLALYDGTWEQPEEILRYWEQKYGLIRL